MCGKSGGRRPITLKQLLRIAREAGSDSGKFYALVDLEDLPDSRCLLAELGATRRTYCGE